MPGDLHKLWRTRDPKGYHVEYGYSCMGYEIAGGLGVKLAAPEREVYVLVGDGSYLMLSSELVTAVQEGREADDRARRQPRLQLDRLAVALARHRRLRHALPLPPQRLPAASTANDRGDYLPVDLAANAESLGAQVIRAGLDRRASRGAGGGEGGIGDDGDRDRGRPLRGRARLRELVGRARWRRSRASSRCAPHGSGTRPRARTSGATCDRRGRDGSGRGRPLPERARDAALRGARRTRATSAASRATSPPGSPGSASGRRSPRASAPRGTASTFARGSPERGSTSASSPPIRTGRRRRPSARSGRRIASRSRSTAGRRRQTGSSRPTDFDPEEVAGARLLYATGTGLAQSPSRETTLAALRAHRGTTIFDLDWRPTLWEDSSEYPSLRPKRSPPPTS